MKNVSIYEALESISVFFGGSYRSYNSIYPIMTYLGMQVLDMGNLGTIEINRKHKGIFSFLGVADKKEIKSVLFICNNDLKYGQERMQVFCVDGKIIYQYKNHSGKSLFTDEQVSGYEGLNMLAVAKKFCEGNIEENLVLSKSKLAADIMENNRMPA